MDSILNAEHIKKTWLAPTKTLSSHELAFLQTLSSHVLAICQLISLG